MLRLRIKELLDELNGDRPRGQRIRIEDVAEEIGVSRGSLAGVTTFTRHPVTNTATMEALYRWFWRKFQEHRPDQPLRLDELFEFRPLVEQTTTTVVDELYRDRADRRTQRRQR